MILRTKIVPKTLADAAVTLFTMLIIPLVYWFELFVVMPNFYQQSSFWYIFHFLMGTFIFINVSSNFMAIIMCDTSISGRIIPTNMGTNWHLCCVCEAMVPPRAWHCNVCNICILKRDHHCMFTSCCIGHDNQRYFIMFVLYIFIACLYATFYNSIFIWSRVDFTSFISVFKVVFPLAMLLFDQSFNQTYLFLYLIVLISCVFTGALLYYHLDLMLRGLVTYERNQKLEYFSKNKLLNVQEVLGERWYLVWISPFIQSKLPQDGINWIDKDSFKSK